MLSLLSADFFQKTLFDCQAVWIQIMTDILSVLLWVQTVCKGYQQQTKVAASKERVESWIFLTPMSSEKSDKISCRINWVDLIRLQIG